MKRAFAAFATIVLLWAQPAAAQSILRDAETETMFADMSAPLIKAAGLSPRNVQVVLINDDSINAFVAGGQTVYVHTGLIQAADNANQVQGVIAHELGHIADGHVLSGAAAAKPAMGMYLLSMVLGLAAMAAGSGDAGAGIMAAGQQAAMGKYLAFSRVQESTADASGVKYLNTAGISGRGMLAFFKKLQQQEYRYGLENIDPFMQSHPLSGERIQTLTADIQKSAAYDKTPDPALEERFRRVKAKLNGYVQDPGRTLNAYPESDNSIYAHYARAYAYHKGGYPDKADAEAAALIRADPHDPFFQEIQGQILLEAGHPDQALVPLRAATAGSRNNPLIATTLGHALIATEDKANYEEAKRVLKTAVARDDENPFAWYQLGIAYERTGDVARASLATAERANMTGDNRTAVQSARAAMAGIPANTPDWIRAQDIAMVSQNAIDDDPKSRKRRR
ncbi:Putative Zn-dependent protease, contains TPR repeats [Sphingomonas gellani]|uniref:Putative Zn-dependent protease, contains TPR repeats n=1 Tax=Sphingomonas gellani TaxID=1166340 RepID=A0A1H8JG46_9SPHN|nr:M48 family metalloprotease [Sphingomonas gellani]SEN79823.1 Putative Zn-dependent protease, contains TPR repeats [Sphingomonas gellani]